MASWHSVHLEVIYQVFGWIAFLSWSFSFYPQVILNYRRKSVVGLNFDFLVLNLTKHSSYLIYNASLYFSHAVQKQYREKYSNKEMIPVAANDVAFSMHAVLLTAITLFQVIIYERGSQKVSKICCLITLGVWISAAVCIFVAIPRHSWFWLIYIFNTIQVIMTVIKYIPQVVMNFRRKSTQGWSIGNILLDLLGGMTNYAQMATQSIDQDSWKNFYGNIGKAMLSLRLEVWLLTSRRIFKWPSVLAASLPRRYKLTSSLNFFIVKLILMRSLALLMKCFRFRQQFNTTMLGGDMLLFMDLVWSLKNLNHWSYLCILSDSL